MKKIFFVLVTAAAIGACNSPQEVTSSPSDSSSTMSTTPVDTTPAMDTTMQGDTMKRDTLR